VSIRLVKLLDLGTPFDWGVGVTPTSPGGGSGAEQRSSSQWSVPIDWWWKYPNRRHMSVSQLKHEIMLDEEDEEVMLLDG